MSSKDSSTPVEIYKKLEDFIIKESSCARNDYENLLRKSVRERILAGKCLNKIRFSRKLGKSI